MKILYLSLLTLCLLNACSEPKTEEKWMNLLYTPLSEEILRQAKNGDSEMQWVVGNCFYNGYGVDMDYSKAVEWFKKSADQGYPGGQANLGFLYYNGIGGLKQDTQLAYEWIQKSVDQNDARGWVILGKYLHLVENNASEAFKCYEKSAKMGYPPAIAGMALCYIFGDGVMQNANKVYVNGQ